MKFLNNCRKTKISNLNHPLVSINKDIITLEIFMNDRWIIAMKVSKTFQDLSAPILDSPNVDLPMLQSIPTESPVQNETMPK